MSGFDVAGPALRNCENLVPRDFLPRMRFAEVLDQFADVRREELVAIFGAIEFRELSMASLGGISQSEAGFDIFFCSVDDVARLRSILIKPADMAVRNKVAFAYSHRTSPGRRARLLRFGFDDVFHSGMTATEILLRVGSIVSRAAEYRSGHTGLPNHEWDDFCKRHSTASLTRNQQRIVQVLLAARGQVVRYSKLASYDYIEHQFRVASLKVIISNLRKSLPSCQIVNVSGRGYALIEQVSGSSLENRRSPARQRQVGAPRAGL